MAQLRGVEQTQVNQHPNAEQRIPMTYADYLHNLDESIHAEWVNGETIIFMPPTLRHQDIVTFLLALLDSFVKIYGLGKLWGAPCAMRLSVTGTTREPDILFLLSANLGRQTENYIAGPADLVIEVISNESIQRDRGDKFYEYQANGVSEYWIIDPRPNSKRADFWVLDADGSYRPVLVDDTSLYHSTVLSNFRLNVSHLLNDDVLDPIQSLIEMVGMEAIGRTWRAKE